ncbi:MAG: TRAP transporter small permease subunit [Polaromonas sp.]
MLERLRQRAVRMAEGIAAAVFALLFLTFVVQVAMRFLFDRPLAWSDELIVVLYILMVFWSAATLLKEKEHVMLDLVYEALPPGGQRLFGLIGAALTAGLLLVLLPEAFDYVRFMHREKTPVLDIPFSYVFAPFILFVVVICMQYIVKFCRLLGRNWQQQL